MRTLLAILITFPVLAQPYDKPVDPFPIAGNIHYVGMEDATSYLITTPKGHILLDGCYAENAPVIAANIRKLGFRVEDVKILINSHAHLDHAGGLKELKRLTGGTLYIMREDVPLLARGGRDDPQFGNRFPFDGVDADRILRDGQRLSLGGTTLTAHHTPGHTRGCTSWSMRVRDGGKPRDVVFVCSATIPNGYDITDNPRYPAAADDYRKTYAKLRSLPCDIPLGSHASFFQLMEKMRAGKGFVDPEGYGKHLDLMEKRFREMLEK